MHTRGTEASNMAVQAFAITIVEAIDGISYLMRGPSTGGPGLHLVLEASEKNLPCLYSGRTLSSVSTSIVLY